MTDEDVIDALEAQVEKYDAMLTEAQAENARLQAQIAARDLGIQVREEREARLLAVVEAASPLAYLAHFYLSTKATYDSEAGADLRGALYRYWAAVDGPPPTEDEMKAHVQQIISGSGST